MSEKVCTLSIDHAIRIAKIITQLFQQAAVDLEGLEELIENSSLTSQTQLVDTEDFIRELTAGRELTARGYLFTPDEFNSFCLERNLQPRLVKRHLYAAGYIEATQETNGKLSYSITVWLDGTAQRRIAVKAQRERPGKRDEG